MIRELLFCFLSTCAAAQQLPPTSKHAPKPVSIRPYEVSAHLQGDAPVLRISSIQERVAGFIQYEITVDETGQVIKAICNGTGHPEHCRAADPIVSKLRFKPFERDGTPVVAIFGVVVPLLPPEEWPRNHAPFPGLKDRKLLKMKLSRACRWRCPAYSISVDGNGNVEFIGTSSVVTPGTHRAKVPTDVVHQLLAEFRAADFFSLRPEYSAVAFDVSTTKLEIVLGNRRMEVKDYDGAAVGMPAIVTTLERHMDAYLDADRWINGNAQTVPSLAAEGFDFKSAEATDMLARVVLSGTSETVRSMLEAGTDPNSKKVVGSPALVFALMENDSVMIDLLLQYGAIPGARGLCAAASTGNPERLELVKRFHPNVNERDSDGRTAIHCAVDAFDRDSLSPDFDPVSVLKTLVSMGAEVNIHDKEGKTPIMNCPSLLCVTSFVEFGADVNAVDNDEQSVLSKFPDEYEIKKYLVEHGARPE